MLIEALQQFLSDNGVLTRLSPEDNPTTILIEGKKHWAWLSIIDNKINHSKIALDSKDPLKCGSYDLQNPNSLQNLIESINAQE